MSAQDPGALLRLREVMNHGPVLRRPQDALLEAAGLVEAYPRPSDTHLPGYDAEAGHSFQVIGADLAGWWDYFVDPKSVGYRR